MSKALCSGVLLLIALLAACVSLVCSLQGLSLGSEMGLEEVWPTFLGAFQSLSAAAAAY